MNDRDLGGSLLATAVSAVSTGRERERSVRRLERCRLTRWHDEIGSRRGKRAVRSTSNDVRIDEECRPVARLALWIDRRIRDIAVDPNEADDQRGIILISDLEPSTTIRKDLAETTWRLATKTTYGLTLQEIRSVR